MPSASLFDHFDDRFFYLSIVNRQRSGGRIGCCIDNPLLLPDTRARAIRERIPRLVGIGDSPKLQPIVQGPSQCVRATFYHAYVGREIRSVELLDMLVLQPFYPNQRGMYVCSWSGLFRIHLWPFAF